MLLFRFPISWAISTKIRISGMRAVLLTIENHSKTCCCCFYFIYFSICVPFLGMLRTPAQGKLRGFTVANGNGGNHSDTMTTTMHPNMTVTETTTMEDDDDDTTSSTDGSGGPSPPPPPPPPPSSTPPARGLRGKIGVLNDFIFLSEITIFVGFPTKRSRWYFSE